jgi:hypothetical protein
VDGFDRAQGNFAKPFSEFRLLQSLQQNGIGVNGFISLWSVV